MYNMATITVTLPVEMLRDLLKISEESGRPINDIAFYAIRAFINNNNPDLKEQERTINKMQSIIDPKNFMK